MAKPSARALRRWAEAPQAEGDTRLGELFRAVGDPQPLASTALARVRDRLGKKRYTSRRSRRVRELVMAGGMLLLGASLALAGWGATEWLSGRSQPALSPAPKTAAPKVSRAFGSQQRESKNLPHEAGPIPEQTPPIDDSKRGPPVEPNAAKAAVTASADRRGVPSASADSSGLAAEALALERALVKLRREHDASGALAVLDESRGLFEKGTLALEAQVARFDALLALGRRAEALALLEQLPIARIGRGGELRLMRAELRASSDCARALLDFDALVTQALAGPLLERALFGRAACELSLGDRTQAEQDLRRYLARFPQGRFAASVRSQLAKPSAQAQ